MGTTIKDNRVIPSSLADKWEFMVKEAGKRLHVRRKRILEGIGDRPYRGMPVNKAEARARWAQVRKDPEAIMNILADNMRTKPTGETLFSRALINEIVDMERHMPTALSLEPEAVMPQESPVMDIPTPELGPIEGEDIGLQL